MADYSTAAKCFNENTQLVDSQNDPLMWNLNNGLRMLTEAIQQDMRRIQNQLNEIASGLPRSR